MITMIIKIILTNYYDYNTYKIKMLGNDIKNLKLKDKVYNI